jgi:hypothetical protein
MADANADYLKQQKAKPVPGEQRQFGFMDEPAAAPVAAAPAPAPAGTPAVGTPAAGTPEVAPSVAPEAGTPAAPDAAAPDFATSYQSLLNDVGVLSQEFAGLQSTSKDPEVMQLAKAATPLLQSFLNSKSEIAGVEKGQQAKTMLGILQTLSGNLQRALAGQEATTPDESNQLKDPSGLGDQSTGGVQMSDLAQFASKAPDAPAIAQAMSSGSLDDNALKYVTDYFESNAVPFTFKNYTQFKNEFVAVMSSQAVAK